MAEGQKRVKDRFGIELEPEVQASRAGRFPAGLGSAVSASGRGSLGGPEMRRLRPARSAVCRVLRRLGPPRVAAVLLAAAVLGATWLWLRDSSLVAVSQVQVTGITGPDSGRIRAALIAAAQHHDHARCPRLALETAVAPYPVVKALDVSYRFSTRAAHPRGGRASGRGSDRGRASHPGVGGRRVLRSAGVKRALPVLSVRALPVGPRLTTASAAGAAVLSAGAGELKTARHRRTRHRRARNRGEAARRSEPLLRHGGARSAPSGSPPRPYSRTQVLRGPSTSICRIRRGPRRARGNINPQLKLEVALSKRSGRLEGWSICKGACVWGAAIDFRHSQAITCKTPLWR